MKHFLDSPLVLQSNVSAKNPTLIDILHTPSKEDQLRNSNPLKRETDSSTSSTTVDEFCEVSFEHSKMKKWFKKNNQ